jgi:extracellular elastinolytic metalloproteinase
MPIPRVRTEKSISKKQRRLITKSKRDAQKHFPIQYKAVPFTRQSPLHEDGFIVVSHTPNTKASPFGWHYKEDEKRTLLTDGNNAQVSFFSSTNGKFGKSYTRATSKNTSVGVIFEEPWDDATGITSRFYPFKASGAVNVFYFVNMFHDLLYELGFTEAAGNFQDSKLVHL